MCEILTWLILCKFVPNFFNYLIDFIVFNLIRPENGGKYCMGRRVKYKSCNHKVRQVLLLYTTSLFQYFNTSSCIDRYSLAICFLWVSILTITFRLCTLQICKYELNSEICTFLSNYLLGLQSDTICSARHWTNISSEELILGYMLAHKYTI